MNGMSSGVTKGSVQGLFICDFVKDLEYATSSKMLKLVDGTNIKKKTLKTKR